MATPLAQSLRPASFRGVPFEVSGADLGAGRRTQLHEYPQRDTPWVEDLGRAARELSFDAIITGPDYVAQANRLLAALEQPGPGPLVHPWFGTVTVSLRELARVAFNSQLGQARVSLSFIESGELTFPAAGASTAAQSRLAADGIQTAAVADFAEKFSIAAMPDFVVDKAIADVTALFDTLGTGRVPGLEVLGYANRIAGQVQTAISLLATPDALGQLVVRVMGIAPLVQTGFRLAALAASLVRLSQSNAFANPNAPGGTLSRQRAASNTTAVNTLARQALLAQAVGVSSLVTDEPHDALLALRNNLADALDVEALQASDAAFAALTTARGMVAQDLTARARESARITTLTPAQTLPALVLAYDLYLDAQRGDEIVRRNALRHPGFVPPRPLKVLTR